MELGDIGAAYGRERRDISYYIRNINYRDVREEAINNVNIELPVYVLDELDDSELDEYYSLRNVDLEQQLSKSLLEGHFKLSRYLINSGQQPNTNDVSPSTLYNIELIELLYNSGIRFGLGHIARAIDNYDIETAKFLLARANRRDPNFAQFNNKVIGYFMSIEDIDSLEFMIEQTENIDYHELLRGAINMGSLKLVEFITGLMDEITIGDLRGATSVYIIEIFEHLYQLVEDDAKKNYRHQLDLMLAAYDEDIELAKKTISAINDIDNRDELIGTAINYAIYWGSLDVLNLYIDEIGHSFVNNVKLAIDRSLYPEAMRLHSKLEDTDVSIISSAIRSKNINIVESLFSYYEDELIIEAVKAKNVYVIENFIDRAPIDERAITIAAEMKRIDLVKFLLDNGAPVDESAAVAALDSNSINILNYLADNNAPISGSVIPKLVDKGYKAIAINLIDRGLDFDMSDISKTRELDLQFADYLESIKY